MVDFERLRTRACAALFVVAALGMTACDKGGTRASIEDARKKLETGDYVAAMIASKAVLQTSSDDAAARFILGSALLKTGVAKDAETELRKALDLGHDADEVEPLIASAMVSQGKARAAVKEFGQRTLGTPRANARLALAMAYAHLRLGDAKEFDAALDSALSLEPDHAPTLLLDARRKAAKGQIDAALAAANGLTERDPKNSEAWTFVGDVHRFGKRDPDKAADAYRKAIATKADYMPAHMSLIQLAFERRDVQAAESQMAAMNKVAPQSPHTAYFRAQLRYLKRDLQGAQDQIQRALRVLPDDFSVLQTAGVIAYELGQLGQAQTHLTKALQYRPGSTLVQRVLAETYMRSGQLDRAESTLQPALRANSKDPDILAVAGEVALRKGELKKAEEYFVHATKLAPDDVAKRTSLALIRLSAGQGEAALGELEALAKTDRGTIADLALISVHMRQKSFEKALASIATLERKQPDKALAPLLRGQALLGKRDVEGARQSLERALSLEPENFSATALLAGIDLQQNKADAAQKRYEDLLARNAKHVPALMAIGELAMHEKGGMDRAIGYFAKAVSAERTNERANVAWVAALLAKPDNKAALDAGRSAVTAVPGSTLLLGLLGRAQLAAGEAQQALTTFNKLAAQEPKSGGPHLMVAQAQRALGNPEAAMQSLRKAISLQPGLVPAQVDLARLSLQMKNPEGALAVARDLQKRHAGLPIGHVLEGDIHSGLGRWQQAAVSYRNALGRKPTTDVAAKLHRALARGSASTSAADSFASEWLKQHPADAAFYAHLGDTARLSADFEGAQRHYEKSLQLYADHAGVLNNLAWVMGKSGKAGALGFAERAVQLAPDQPAFMDTLAELLLASGQRAKAIEWERKALALRPESPGYKFALAKMLLDAGEKGEALGLLRQLADLGDKFPGHEEVQALLKRAS